MENEKLVPKLRFSGFDDEWEETTLIDISDKIGDGMHATPNYVDKSEYFFINGNNLIDKQIVINENTKCVPLEEYESHKINFNNTILMSINGTIGNLAYYNNEKVILGKSSAYINLNDNINKEFIFNYLQIGKIKYYFQSELTGTTIKNLSLKTLKNTKINLPNLREQNKISDFLENVDKKISLLENKHKYYQDFKKYLMQQIFAQKLRFNDNCQYTTKKVKDFLVESKIEGTDDINKRLSVKLNLKGITIRESKAIEIEGATKQFIRKSGQFIYGKQNLHKGAFGIVPKELDGYLTSSDIPSFDFKGEIDPKWFYYYFSRKSFYEKLERLSTGTGSKRISPKDFLNIKLIVPEIEEQHRIVYLLSKFDEKINGISNQIVQMNMFKKSLLQQMFVLLRIFLLISVRRFVALKIF